MLSGSSSTDCGSDLTAAYLAAGIMKATRPKEMLAQPLPWTEDFSPATIRFIGIVEALGAVGLILPWLTASPRPHPTRRNRPGHRADPRRDRPPATRRGEGAAYQHRFPRRRTFHRDLPVRRPVTAHRSITTPYRGLSVQFPGQAPIVSGDPVEVVARPSGSKGRRSSAFVRKDSERQSVVPRSPRRRRSPTDSGAANLGGNRNPPGCCAG